MTNVDCHVREGLKKGTRENWREACKQLDIYDKHEGKPYCVLHFPGKDKKYAFEQALSSKSAVGDYYFAGTVFPEGTSDFRGREFKESADFTGAAFLGDASFRRAIFRGNYTSFSEAIFHGRTSFSKAKLLSGETTFEKATFGSRTHFIDTTLCNAIFEKATFKHGANFSRAEFGGTRTPTTDFRRATFDGEMYFKGAQFEGFTDFYRANFLDAVKFIGRERDTDQTRDGKNQTRQSEDPSPVFALQGHVSFVRARIEKPELFSFHTAKLRPSWFVGVDARKFDFTIVQWQGIADESQEGGYATRNLKKRIRETTEALKEKDIAQAWRKLTASSLDDEIAALQRYDVPSPHTSLEQACQRLAANAEENRDYPLANDFYYWSMEALRKAGWRRLGLIRAMYWALSGYGVKPGHALGVLLVICVVFAMLYMWVGPSSLQVLPIRGIGQALTNVWQAMMYSLGVMARLRPEPIPTHIGPFQILVTLEGILGPLQIALLVLAVRRKVMR